MWWWNPRFLALAYCVGMLGRWSYRAALNQLEGEFGGFAALLTFWIPLVGVIWLLVSVLAPIAMRRLSRRRG